MHLNHFIQGTTTPGPGGEVPTDHLTHLTFEPHLGITRWWELGMYLQTVLRPDGGWDSGGMKLRTKFRWPESVGAFRFALNIELARVSKRYEADGWGGELRPIVDARWGRWYLAFNPIVCFSLAGDDAWKPEFEPATKVELRRRRAAGRWGSRPTRPSASVRELPALGPADAPALRGDRLHRAAGSGINVGVGYGTGPERWIVKAIVSPSLRPREG